MDPVRQFTNRCACGWEFRGSLDPVVDATIDHGKRIHNMDATREEVVAALGAADERAAQEAAAAPAEGAAGR
jgi:predicted small metal-binding protein